MFAGENKMMSMILGIALGIADYNFIEAIDSSSNIYDWNINISFLIVFNLIMMLFALKLAKVPALSFTNFFLVTAISFNCGQCFVNYLGLELFNFGNVFTLFGIDVYIKSVVYSLYGIYFCFIGILINQLMKDMKMSFFDKINILPCIQNNQLKYYKSITIVLLIISLPAQLYITYTQIVNNVTFGYNAAALMSIPPVITYAAKFLISAVILALYQVDVEYKNKIYISYIALNLITMIGGGTRSSSLLALIIVSYAYFFIILEKKISLKNVIIIGLIGIFVVQLLVAIRDMRSYGFSLSLLFNVFFIGENSALGSYFAETTTTQSVIGYIISYSGVIEHPVLGQFFSSILGIIPGIGEIVPWDLNKYDMQKAFNIAFLGGSFIADFYFDHVLYIGTFLWGIFISKVFSNFEQEHNIVKCAFWAPIVSQIIYSVRSTTAQLPRMIVWMGIVYILVFLIFTMKNKKIK